MFVKQYLSFLNLCWIFPVKCFIWFGMAPRRIHSIIFPGTEVWWAYNFLDTPLALFVDDMVDGMISVICQSSEISPDFHNCSKVWKAALWGCHPALLITLGGHCLGPSICQGQAPVIVHIPIFPSLTVGLCLQMNEWWKPEKLVCGTGLFFKGQVYLRGYLK